MEGDMKSCVGDFGMMRSKGLRADLQSKGKRNYRPIIIVAVMLGVCLGGMPVWGAYGGGSGEPNELFLIYDAAQLQMIGGHPPDFPKKMCNKKYGSIG